MIVFYISAGIMVLVAVGMFARACINDYQEFKKDKALEALEEEYRPKIRKAIFDSNTPGEFNRIMDEYDAKCEKIINS